MNQLFLITADYLKGKPIYAPLRRILNFVFNISVASFIFEKIYGHYEWLDINDYKGLLNFFIKGKFFIPFSIYIIVLGVTYFLSVILFSMLSHIKTMKLTREIISYEATSEIMDENIEAISKVSNKILPIDLDKHTLIELYGEFRKELKPEVFDKIENELKSPKTSLEETFRLCLRGIVAITIYFISLPEFGCLLYLLTLIVLGLSMYLIILSYRFLDILPTLVRKFNSIAENYFIKHKKVDQ